MKSREILLQNPAGRGTPLEAEGEPIGMIRCIRRIEFGKGFASASDGDFIAGQRVVDDDILGGVSGGNKNQQQKNRARGNKNQQKKRRGNHISIKYACYCED